MSKVKWWQVVDADGRPSIISTPATKRPGDCGYDESTLASVLPLAREPGEFDDVDPNSGAVSENKTRKDAAARCSALARMTREELVDLIQDTVAEMVADVLGQLVPGVTITPAQREIIRGKARIDPLRPRPGDQPQTNGNRG
jgi:hypothetical protein